MLRYEIRAALLADEAELHALAHYLNTVNLPDDRTAIREILELSQHSFDGSIKDPNRREFVFMLRDLARNEAVATSMIIAQLGRRGSPYIYLDVDREEKYSATLDKHFIHPVLSVRYSYNGPTEIGGLVVHPNYRSGPDKLGTMISFVRFLFIAIHRQDFRDELLAELLPPLEPDGTSHLWEALGRHFTGLSYLEADKLSKRNKEFIRGLFPQGEIYATLLSPKAQEVIGVVGEQTRGVEKMLTRVGFRYAERIDPFDGGPHFVAPTDEVSLVRAAHRAELVASDKAAGTTHLLLAKVLRGPPYFTAVPTVATPIRDGVWGVSEDVLRHFDAAGEGELWAMPTATSENVTRPRSRS